MTREEALEVIKGWVLKDKDREALETILPELKVSEDEKMRKVAIRACKYMVDNFENSTKDYEDAIAWLEKQGKPIFKDGDWIIYKDDHTGEEEVLLVSNPDPNGTSLYTVEGQQKYYLDWNSLKSAKLWTLQDAKPGDILKYYSSIFILKKRHDNFVETYCALNEDEGDFIIDDEFSIDKGIIKPASREQRDRLFARIKRSGYYEWDEMAKKLVNSTLKEKEDIDAGFTKMIVDDKVKEDIKFVLSNSDLSKVSTHFSDMLDWINEKDKLKMYLKEANRKKQELAKENYYLKTQKHEWTGEDEKDKN